MRHARFATWGQVKNILVIAACLFTGSAADSDPATLQVTDGGFEATNGSADNPQPRGWATRLYAGEVRAGPDDQMDRRDSAPRV